MYKDGFVSFEAFIPDSKTGAGRADGGLEVSINWLDAPEAVEVTKKRNLAQFGIAKLATTDIESVRKIPSHADTISYERRDPGDNCYHGNIVFRKGTPGVDRIVNIS